MLDVLTCTGQAAIVDVAPNPVSRNQGYDMDVSAVEQCILGVLERAAPKTGWQGSDLWFDSQVPAIECKDCSPAGVKEKVACTWPSFLSSQLLITRALPP